MNGDYLTPAEFAALSSDAQHAIWKAADAGLVGWRELRNGNPRQYRRDDVEKLLGEVTGG